MFANKRWEVSPPKKSAHPAFDLHQVTMKNTLLSQYFLPCNLICYVATEALIFLCTCPYSTYYVLALLMQIVGVIETSNKQKSNDKHDTVLKVSEYVKIWQHFSGLH